MKLLLVGLDNPQSRDPRHALYPSPAGCAGHRLWRMMSEVDATFTESSYKLIVKTNLFPVGPAPRKFGMYHANAGDLLRVQMQDQDRRVVLLGSAVRDSVLDSPPNPMVFVRSQNCLYAWIPHPSGRNRFYNDPENCRAVGRWLLEELRK